MANYKRSNFTAKLIVLSSIIVSPLIIGHGGWTPANHPASKTGQGSDKILEKGDEFDPPVSITLIKSKIGVIERDKKIDASDDWVQGLVVRLRNDSDKPVTHVAVELRFRRPPNGAKDYDFVSTIEYGPGLFDSPHTASPDSPAPILPGETAEVTLSNADYESIKSALDELRYPKGIKRVGIGIKEVIFNDGTAWIAGVIFRRDPNNPNRWVPEKKSRQGRGEQAP